MAYELTGKIKFISETQTFASGFCKRFMVIEKEDGNYTNCYGVEALKENVSKFDGFNIGEEVVVSVFENSLAKVREYNDKWYSDMPTVMKVERMGDASEVPEPAPKADEPEDDIPF
jgi:hypothetical protein